MRLKRYFCIQDDIQSQLPTKILKGNIIIFALVMPWVNHLRFTDHLNLIISLFTVTIRRKEKVKSYDILGDLNFMSDILIGNRILKFYPLHIYYQLRLKTTAFFSMTTTTISYENLFQLLPEACCVLRGDGKLVIANKLFEDTIVSMQRGANYVFLEDLIHGDDKDLFRLALSEVKNGLTASAKSVRTLTCGKSNDFPIFRRYNWLMNGGLGDDAVILSGRMVTVVDGEEDVEGEFLDFFQRAPIALHWLSETGHILWANDTELQVLGYTAEEYIGQPVMKFCPDEEELVLEIFKQLGSGNTIKDVPVRFRTKHGEIRHLLIDSNVNWNSDGSFRHTRCFIRDDTGRKIREAITSAEKATATKTATAIDACLRRVIYQIRKQLFTAQDYLLSMSNGDTKDMRQIESQMERIMGNLDDLAFATMCENGHVIALKPVPLQLDYIIRNIFAKAAFIRRAGQRVELELKMDDAPNDILADASIIRVLHHLISNAIQYSDDDAKIRVEISFMSISNSTPLIRSHRGRVLRMNDNSQRRGIFTFQVSNPTVQAMDLDSVYASFQKYYSASVSNKYIEQADKAQGLGVGLNVAYNMIQMMGGTLECSATPTESCFWFSLDLVYEAPGTTVSTTTPTNRADLVPVAPGTKVGLKAGLSSIAESQSKWTTVQESVVAQHCIRHDPEKDEFPEMGDNKIDISCFAHRKRVLIVDDSTICQRVLAKVLKRLSIDCDVASNVLTADNSEEAKEENCMEAGASAYLTKPATLNDIKTVLKRFSTKI
eukprot:gene7841-16042_t